jgi:two-component system OmpR family sensor kinase
VRHFLLPRTLRGRIIVAYVAGLVVAVAAFGLAGSVLLINELREASTDDLAARLGDVAAAVQAGDLTPINEDPYAQVLSGNAVLARSPATPALPVLTAAERAEASRHRIVVHRPVPGLGNDAILAATALPSNRIAVVGANVGTVDVAAQRIVLAMAGLVTVLLILLTLGVYRLVGAALRPVATLTAEARDIGAARPGRRLPVPEGDDEISALAATLNAMLGRIAEAAERERAFLDNAAHELRNPVATLRAQLELGLASKDPGDTHDALQKALREADRLGRLTSDMLVLARSRGEQLPLARTPTDVADRVRETAHRVGAVAQVAVEVGGDDVVANVDPLRLDQAITNLVANAGQAGASRVRVTVAEEPDAAVSIIVDDDGPGFAPALLPVAFERFTQAAPARTPRGDGGGAGLGLAIVDTIAVAHDGYAEASNDSPLGGARVRVVLR